MKIILLNIVIVFLGEILFSQNILIPENDSIVLYNVIIKKTGNNINYDEYAYYKLDTSKIAWIKHVKNGKIVGVYKEFFINTKTYKKLVYNKIGQRYGVFQEWNENGELIISGQYKKDKKNGTWLYIKEKRNEVYKNGIKQGRWRIYEGKVPWSLYVYRKDTLKRVKK